MSPRRASPGRPRSSHFALALLALGLLALLAALAQLGARPPTAHAGPPESLGLGASASEAERGELAARASEEAAAEAAERAAAEPPVAAVGAGAESVRREGLRVLVRRREDRAAVPEAELVYVDSGEFAAAAWERAPYQFPTLEARLRALGHTAQSDAQGLAYLPRPSKRLYLVARHGGAYASVEAAPQSEEPLCVDLAPLRSLQVLAKDASGKALAGVPVAVRSRLGSETRLLWEGVTQSAESSALATVVDLDGLQARAEGADLYVGLGFPLREPVEQRVDFSNPPSAPIELELPPVGSLLLRMYAPGGAPLQAAGLVQFAREPSEGGPGRVQTQDLSRYTVLFEGGEAVLPYLGLGLKLSLRLRADGYPRQSLSAVDGPGAAGQQMLREHTFARAQPVLCGRVLDAQGAPLASARVKPSMRWQPGGQNFALDEWLATDAEGRFRLVLRQDYEGSARRELALAQRDAAGQRWSGSALLPPKLPGGECELGDLRLAAELPLAAGLVVDEEGTPVPGASVWLERAVPRDSGETRYERVGESGGTSDEQGAFALFGQTNALALSALAYKEGYQRAERVPCASGARELRVLVQRGGALEGALLFDPSLARERLALGLRRPAQKRPADWEQLNTLAGRDGRFRFAGVAAGTWEFRLTLDGEEQPLLTVADVRVEAGQTCRDERLQHIDLRALVHGLTVEVRDAAGQPAENGYVCVLDLARGPECWSSKVDLRGGRARVASSRASVDLDVWASGSRPARRLAVSADCSIRLEPGIALELACTDAGAPLRGGAGNPAYLWLHCEQAGEPRTRAPWREQDWWIALDSAGVAHACVPAEGRYLAMAYAPGGSQNNEWTGSGPAGPGSEWELAVDERGGARHSLAIGPAPAAAAAGNGQQ